MSLTRIILSLMTINSIVWMASCETSLRRLNPIGTIQQDVAGIIISFHSGHSYDELFSKVKQQSKEGSIVLTYIAQSGTEKHLLEALLVNFQHSDSTIRELVGEVQKLTLKCPSCVVFNWECSSGFSNSQFMQGKIAVFDTLELIIKRGYIGMFSDFSLKALIREWNSTVLGSNPFQNVGETSTSIILKFDKNSLMRSPSSQLQAVARLAASDELVVHVLGGTIMYAVDSRVQSEGKYELQVLTIASNFPAPSSHLQSKIGRYTGLPAHTVLNYPSGGKVITSMGHWIELMKIDTTEQQLIDTTEQLYGKQQSQKIQREYGALKTKKAKTDYLAAKSKLYVQNQSPGANMVLVNQKNKKDQPLDL